MEVEQYRKIYEMILEMSMDADGFNTTDNITEDEIAKCKWISLMLNTITDVPARKAAAISLKMGLDLDNIEFMDVGFYDN
jgi:hypothetical protein